MNKHTRLVVSVLFIVIIALAIAITRFYSGSEKITGSGSEHFTIERKLDIDGRGNRVAASVSGPKKVVYVIGRNKIVEGGIDAAIARIKAKACPPNCVRLGKKTPCAVTGKCADCDSPDRICKVTVVMDRRPSQTDAYVLIVDEDLGY